MFRLRSLSGLLAFDAAARHSSLTLAAEELGRTQSAISQQVKALETELGLQLFVRRPREVTLTPAGRALAATLRTALSDIETTVTGLKHIDDPYVLRLTTYQSFAIHWLIPRLPRFSLQHPEIDVRINADDRVLDLQAEGIDLAIRIGTAPKDALVLLPETFVPVYAPGIASSGRIDAEDAVQYRLLAHQYASLWHEWLELNGRVTDTLEIATDYSHSGLLVQAAVAGGGIALAPPMIAADAIYDGRLHYIGGKPYVTGSHYYIETAKKDTPQGEPEKVQKFLSWMREEAKTMRAGNPDWFDG